MMIMFITDQGKPEKISEMERNLSGQGKGNFDSRTDSLAGLRMMDSLMLRLLHYKRAGGWKAGLVAQGEVSTQVAARRGNGGQRAEQGGMTAPLLSLGAVYGSE